MTGLENGNRFSQDVVLRTLVEYGLSRDLEAWVCQENQLVWENEMREIKELAVGLKESLAALKSASAGAKASLLSEMNRAKVNAEKVQSLAVELKEANAEVEDFLGETGSNFPSSGDSSTPPPKPDINGVTINQEPGK
jgi:membrane protein involved in colicin uptake